MAPTAYHSWRSRLMLTDSKTIATCYLINFPGICSGILAVGANFRIVAGRCVVAHKLLLGSAGSH